jgi:hypothetical protein
MVHNRSGLETTARAGDSIATQQGMDVPTEVEVPTQEQQGEVLQPVSTPQVYTAGTYAATFRPSQFKKPEEVDQAKERTPLRSLLFEAPMRPLDVSRNMYLDYTATQSIKFYNKGCEKLAGEDGKLLLTWLLQVQDKAVMFTWIPILTIKGKLLTQQFAELSMEEVRAHA